MQLLEEIEAIEREDRAAALKRFREIVLTAEPAAEPAAGTVNELRIQMAILQYSVEKARTEAALALKIAALLETEVIGAEAQIRSQAPERVVERKGKLSGIIYKEDPDVDLRKEWATQMHWGAKATNELADLRRESPGFVAAVETLRPELIARLAVVTEWRAEKQAAVDAVKAKNAEKEKAMLIELNKRCDAMDEAMRGAHVLHTPIPDSTRQRFQPPHDYQSGRRD